MNHLDFNITPSLCILSGATQNPSSTWQSCQRRGNARVRAVSAVRNAALQCHWSRFTVSRPVCRQRQQVTGSHPAALAGRRETRKAHHPAISHGTASAWLCATFRCLATGQHRAGAWFACEGSEKLVLVRVCSRGASWGWGGGGGCTINSVHKFWNRLDSNL